MKKYLFILSIILCLTLVSSAVPSLGFFKEGNDIELKQTCTINGTFCNYCNISSVDYPNGTIVINDVEMTKRNGDFNYTLDGSYTDGIYGTYKVNGYCTFGSDVIKNWVYYVDVNPTGEELGIQTSIIYIIIFIISILVLVSLLVLGIYLPVSNNRDEMTGYILAINNLKYLKILLLSFAYLTAFFISFFTYYLSRAFLWADFITNIAYFIFVLMAILILPFFIFMIYLFIANWIKDNKLYELISRGLKVR